MYKTLYSIHNCIIFFLLHSQHLFTCYPTMCGASLRKKYILVRQILLNHEVYPDSAHKIARHAHPFWWWIEPDRRSHMSSSILYVRCAPCCHMAIVCSSHLGAFEWCEKATLSAPPPRMARTRCGFVDFFFATPHHHRRGASRLSRGARARRVSAFVLSKLQAGAPRSHLFDFV